MTPIKPRTARRLGLRQPGIDRFNEIIDYWLTVFTRTVGPDVAEAVRAEVAASRELQALRADRETALIRRVDRAVQALTPIFAQVHRAEHPR